MSLINKEISDFKAYAFHGDEFKMVSKEEILGKWSVFFFYPADFTFVCPTELENKGGRSDLGRVNAPPSAFDDKP